MSKREVLSPKGKKQPTRGLQVVEISNWACWSPFLSKLKLFQYFGHNMDGWMLITI
jgi:hypothetical protein